MTEMDEQGRPEPPFAGDETSTLLGSLERQRATLAWKSGGLDAPGMRTTVGCVVDERLARYTAPSGESPSLRRLLIDLIEDSARHVGRADLIRESVDGLTGEDPPG
jgi:hypothetical protein